MLQHNFLLVKSVDSSMTIKKLLFFTLSYKPLELYVTSSIHLFIVLFESGTFSVSCVGTSHSHRDKRTPSITVELTNSLVNRRRVASAGSFYTLQFATRLLNFNTGASQPASATSSVSNWLALSPPEMGYIWTSSSTIIRIAAPAKQSSPHHWQFSKAHTGSRFAYGVQNSVCI
jgi:hypothetical protein